MTTDAIQSYSDITAISSTPAVHSPEPGGGVSFSEALQESKVLYGGRADLDSIFEAAGRRYNLSPNLLKAVAKAESGFRL